MLGTLPQVSELTLFIPCEVCARNRRLKRLEVWRRQRPLVVGLVGGDRLSKCITMTQFVYKKCGRICYVVLHSARDNTITAGV